MITRVVRRPAMALAATVAAVMAATTIAGCDGADQPAQFAPSLPYVAGFRVVGGALEAWTGPPCEDVDQVAVFLEGGRRDLRAVYETETPRTVKRIRVGERPVGFRATEDLPRRADWRDFDTVGLSIGGPRGGGPAETEVDPLVTESGEHPGDYYVPGFGWMSAADLLDRNEQDFLTVCTPDPEQ